MYSGGGGDLTTDYFHFLEEKLGRMETESFYDNVSQCP